MRAAEIAAVIEDLAPLRLAASWDNCGWQIGDGERPVRGVLVSLDVDGNVLAEALDRGANLVVAHHPLIFRPIARLDLRDPKGRLIAELIKRDVLVYAAHTNLDLAPGGVNETLAARLGLQSVEPLEQIGTVAGPDGERAIGWGAVGDLPRELTSGELGELARDRLGTSVVRIVGGRPGRHRRLAVCGGSGSEFLGQAAAAATAFLTSDVRYHQAQEAQALGLCLIDVGHYYSERPVLESLADVLRERTSVPTAVSTVCTSPFDEPGSWPA